MRTQSDIFNHGKRIAENINSNREKILSILTQYESYETALSEIEGSVNTLNNLESNKQFMLPNMVHSLAVFLPSNLPLYSLVINGLVPSYLSFTTSIRITDHLQKCMDDISQALNLNKEYPLVEFYSKLGNTFVSDRAMTSDVVIFTGKPENAQKISKKIGKDALFIYNGVGQNPIVVEKDAPLDLSVQKTLDASLYNSGQDCAKPNIILLHDSISKSFVDKLSYQLDSIKFSCQYTPDVKVGKLLKSESLADIGSFLLENGRYILKGGVVDYKNGLVTPTLLNVPFSQDISYRELYGPIIYTVNYHTDEDLKSYFENGDYKSQNMYVSLFGNNHYLENNSLLKILHDKIVLDIDDGNQEFGGWGSQTSWIRTDGIKLVKPILIPREIKTFAYDKVLNLSSLHEVGIGDNTISQEKAIIANVFQKTVENIFSDNLNFCFICGDFARNREKFNASIPMVVCVKKHDEQQEALFKNWYFKFHAQLGRTSDSAYPGEIFTFEELKQRLSCLQTEQLKDFSLDNASCCDAAVWACSIFADKKIGVLDDEKKLEIATCLCQMPFYNLIEKYYTSLDVKNISEKEVRRIKEDMFRHKFSLLIKTQHLNAPPVKVSSYRQKWIDEYRIIERY